MRAEEPATSQLPGWIDSASLYQVVDYFDKLNPYPWNAQVVIGLTILFMQTDFQEIGRANAKNIRVDDHQRLLTDELIKFGLAKPAAIDEGVRRDAVAHVKRWALAEPVAQTLRTATNSLLKDTVNFNHWIRWVISSNSLKVHGTTHTSLMDADFAVPIGHILGFDEHHLQDLIARASDASILNGIQPDHGPSGEIDLIGAYMCSAFLRGAVHARIAGNERQLSPHPLRAPVLSLITTRDQRPALEPTWTMKYLAEVVVLGATRRHSLRERLMEWVSQIDKVRRFLRDPTKKLVEVESPEGGLKEAMRIAHAADLHILSPREEAFAHSIGVMALVPAIWYVVKVGDDFLNLQGFEHLAELGLHTAGALGIHVADPIRRGAGYIERFEQETLLRRGAGLLVRQGLTVEGA